MSKIKLILFLLLLSVLSTYYFFPYKPIPEKVVIDKIIVLKSQQRLQAYSKGTLIKNFTVSLGKIPFGDKQIEDDKKTPEGTYFIDSKNPSSSFHKNLGISYPNRVDLNEARTLGQPAGGDIKIHGLDNRHGYIGRFHRWANWTNGCIALTNQEIDDLYKHTPVGTIITIQP